MQTTKPRKQAKSLKRGPAESEQNAHKPRAFLFSISPTTTPETNIEIFGELANALKAASKALQLSGNLAGIVVFPIVADAETYKQSDFLIHRRSDRAFYVGRNIDYEVWQKARRTTRLRLCLETICAAIDAIPSKHLPASDKEELMAVTKRVVARL